MVLHGAFRMHGRSCSCTNMELHWLPATRPAALPCSVICYEASPSSYSTSCFTTSK